VLGGNEGAIVLYTGSVSLCDKRLEKEQTYVCPVSTSNNNIFSAQREPLSFGETMSSASAIDDQCIASAIINLMTCP